jgi:hypothetical protein
MLSDRQRVGRMRRVAVRALHAYPLVDPELRFVADEENATFRVDATAPDGRDRFLLRVHRPARHGRNVDSAAAVGSELGLPSWGRPLPVRMNPCSSRLIWGGSQPVCGTAPMITISAEAGTVWVLPVLVSFRVRVSS